MAIEVLDPTNEMSDATLALAPRLATFEGATVGIVTNGKEGTKGYFTHLDRLMRSELGVRDVVWTTKANYSAPAERAIVDRMKEWQVVVAGVGD
jgi:hypothetical protein